MNERPHRAEEKAENRTACRAEVDEDSFSVAVVAGYTAAEKL
jgi:hypothetical protein